MSIGTKLKMLRSKKKVTQKELSTYLGISERAYQHYESNTREPPLSNVIKLADYFEVSIDYLVGRTDDPTIYKYKSKALRFSEDRNIQEDYNPIRDILRNLPKNMDK